MSIRDNEILLNGTDSNILNNDNVNIFKGITKLGMDKLNLVYSMTRDGTDKGSLQEKIKGKSNLIIIVKTDRNRIFGGHIKIKIEYNNKDKMDKNAYLFSLDLNEKFKLSEDAQYAISDYKHFGLCFGNCDMVLFGRDNICYVGLGAMDSQYNDNEMTRKDICFGITSGTTNEFTPIEIEVYRIKKNNKCIIL